MTTVHVVPLGDPFAHVVPGGYGRHDTESAGWLVIEQVGPDDEGCVCGPRLKQVSSAAGESGWIVVHRALTSHAA